MLVTALVLSLSIPLLDLVAAARKGLWNGGHLGLVPPATSVISTGAFVTSLLLAFGLAWGLACLVARRWKGSRTSLAAGVAVGLALPALLFVAELFDVVEHVKTDWPRITVLAVLCLGAGPLGFWTAEGLRSRPRAREIAAALALALPPALLLAYCALLVEDGLHIPLRSAGYVLLAATYAALAFGLVVVLRKPAARVQLGRGLLALAAVLLIAASALILRGPPRPAPPEVARYSAKVPRVLLICVDTLRSDGLSCYGGKISTPHMDALARESVCFESAHSNAPWTLPSVASMLTGLTPLAHDVVHIVDNGFDSMRPLAERLRAAGYRTGSIGYNPFLSGRHAHFDGLQSSIEEPLFGPWIPSGSGAAFTLWGRLFPASSFVFLSTDDLTRLAVDWIAANAQTDWFLWVHYFDPHGPYEPPPPWMPAGAGTRMAKESFDPAPHGRRALDFSPEDLARIGDLYGGEVRWVDAGVGAIVQRLKDLSQFEDTLIVLTSDHGDELMEHGGLGHGHTLYEELLHVPLLIKPAGPSSGRSVANRVALDSLVPTVLELLEVPFRPDEFSGRSLVPLWTGAGGEGLDHPSFATAIHNTPDGGCRSVIFRDFKYVKSLRSGREELYDLESDPGELHDLSLERPEVVEQARALLEAERVRSQELRAALGLQKTAPDALDPDTLRLLRGLGYF